MEEYTAHHSETVEELMGWPWLRVEKFYEAHLKRMVVEELQKRKIAMMTALYANTNFDGSENSSKREQALQRMEEQFQEAIRNLYRTPQQVAAKAAEEDLEGDPFFQPMYKSLREKGILDEKPKPEYEIDQE